MNIETDNLKCDKCGQIFNSKPLRLPCQHVICSEHKSFIKTDRNSIICPFCYPKTMYETSNKRHKLTEIKVDKDIYKKITVINFTKITCSILNKINSIDALWDTAEEEIDKRFDCAVLRIKKRQKKELESLKSYFEEFDDFVKDADELDDSEFEDLNITGRNTIRNFLDEYEANLKLARYYEHFEDMAKVKQFDSIKNSLYRILDKCYRDLLFPLPCYYLTSKSFQLNYDKFFGSLQHFKFIVNKFILIDTAGDIKLYSLDTKTYLGNLRGKMCNKKLLKFLSNGYLVTGEHEAVRLWDLSNMKRIKTITNIPSVEAKRLIVTPDNHVIYCCKEVVRVWKWENEIFSSIGMFKANTFKSDKIECMKYSPKHGLALAHNNHVEIWSISDKIKLVKKFDQINKFIMCMKFLSENKLITGSMFGHLTIWDLDDLEVSLHHRKIEYREGFGVFKKIKVLPDKRILTFVSNLVSLWDSDLNFLMEINEVEGPIRILQDYQLAYTEIHQSPFIIKVMDLNDYRNVRQFKGHVNKINFIQTLRGRDGLFMSTSNDNYVKIWNLDTEMCIKSFMVDTPIEYFKFYE